MGVHGGDDPHHVQVEVHDVGDLHGVGDLPGVVEGSCHVCGEGVHCVCHARVVCRVCEHLLRDLHGVVEEVCGEGDLHCVVQGSNCDHGGGGGAEGEEAHGGDVFVVWERGHGAACQVWDPLRAGS